jgi:serine/threonine protein kinase
MEDLTGKQFGPYQIVAPLGEGGMAAVYKAYQPSMERYVAMKVLPRHMAESAEFIARFKREAHLLAQLQHPHILPVFDYDQSEGYAYIVMPFIHSGTLADLLKTRRMSLPEIRRTLTQVGEALGYAHTRGMIHRDVKPSNVLIDESGNCLLTDFGLARMTEASAHLTSSGAVMGTPAYMSPEQGMGAKLDGRSDIYSLGIILYEMVTGQVPYSAETPIAVVFKHIQDPLPSARKLTPDLPDDLERVLLKSLAKSPADRYQSAEDFVQAIQMAIPAHAPAEKPDPTAPQATRVAAPPTPMPSVASAPQPPAPPPAAPPRPIYRPVSLPSMPARKKRGLPWILAGIGIIGACCIGIVLVYLGFTYPAVAPIPITAQRATLTPTLPAPSTILPAPPRVKSVRINAITVDAQNQYVVDYVTYEYTEGQSGMHVNFFFNTSAPARAGVSGNGPWKVYDGPRPFTGYNTSDRPENASQICALVENVLPKSGNCLPLPDVPTVTARVDTTCLKNPTTTRELAATFKAGATSLLKGISNDKAWLFIQNPEKVDTSTCWVPGNSSVTGGDTSHVPLINP